MHIDERDEVASAAQQENLDALMFFMIVRVATTVVAAHIYREDPPRVIAFRNRLGLSLSKCIRHGLVEKINGKRKPRTCEALGQILVHYSHTRHAPAPITSPCHARRGEVSERACVSSFLLSSTHLQMHREQPIL